MEFLHGIQTTFEPRANASFTGPMTSVIALIGTAPKGAPDTLTLVNSRRDAQTKFGTELSGFTIPYALEAIYKQGGGATVLVVNTFDPDSHNLVADDDPVAIANGRGVTLFNPNTAVVLTSADGNTTYVQGTDYTIDAFGEVRVIDGTVIADGTTPLAGYSYFDPTTVTSAESVASLEVLDMALPSFGYTPKIIIAPEHCENEAVALKMFEKATSFGAVYFVDAPKDKTVTEVKQGRGPLGGIPGFRNANKNLQPMYPYAVTLDSKGETVSRPLSPFIAGVAARSDNEFGVQRSLSNQVLTGVIGADTVISSSYTDPASDANQLNKLGVMTLFNTQDRGMVSWGNRNASAPSNTEQDVFLSIERTKLMLIEAININNVRFLDRGTSSGLVNAIIESNNAYLRGLKSQGIIVDGKMTLDSELTTTAEIAQGRLYFSVDFAGISPAERLTFTLAFNPDYLESVIA